MVKVLVIGAAGRMGRMIVSSIENTDGVGLSAATEIAGSSHLGADAGELAGIGAKNVTLVSVLDAALVASEVVIDFTTPESTMETFRTALRLKKAIVIGTTGFSEEQKNEIRDAEGDIRCVLAPNMSIGVNVLFKIAGEMARVLGDAFDVEIVEAHHKYKKDAPSGTAVRLSEIIADALGRNLNEVGVYGRKGTTEVRGPREIGVHTVRAGDIVGEHRVIFGGMGETLEISHRAQSRETFARGAVTAAKWIVHQPPGVYDMKDVLNLREKGFSSSNATERVL